MNKKSWLQVLLVHHAHKNEKTVWTVNELREKTRNNISQAHIRDALSELESMGLIEHEKHTQKYYFDPEA